MSVCHIRLRCDSCRDRVVTIGANVPTVAGVRSFSADNGWAYRLVQDGHGVIETVDLCPQCARAAAAKRGAAS